MSNRYYTELLAVVEFSKRQAQVPGYRGPKTGVHGLTDHPIHRAWSAMHQRCTNRNRPQFKDYGGRGIRVCRAWESFQNFFDDMGPTWAPGLSLDRIENDGDYGPQNCRWTTQAEQTRNRRNNVFVATPHGHRLLLADAVFCYGSKARKFRRIEGRPL